MYVEFMKNFLLADSSKLMAVIKPETFDSYFLDIMYGQVHEKFSYRLLEH